MLVGNRTKMGHPEAIRQGRMIRDTIHSNQKKIRVITNSIRRDRNEAIYNLEKYDDEISRIVQQLAELTGKKQEALNTFNTVTQTIICDEITSNSKEKIDTLKDQYETAEEKRSQLEHQIRQQSLDITDKCRKRVYAARQADRAGPAHPLKAGSKYQRGNIRL